MTIGNRLSLSTFILLTFLARDITCLGCSEFIGEFPSYACAQEEAIGAGSFASAFLISQGGKQFVFKVQDIKTEISRKLALDELNYLQLFKGEQYLVQLIDHKRTDDYLFQVLQYGSKGSLDKFRTDNPNYFEDSAKLLRFAQKVMIGLRNMHQKGVVHGDFTNNSIVVDENDDPLLIDFTSSVENGHMDWSRGTPLFMDPILLNAEFADVVEFNEFRNIYSLGVVLYTLSQGRFPFEVKKLFKSQNAVNGHTYPFKQGTNLDVVNIIHSCLRMSENDRETIHDLIDIVDEALARQEPGHLAEDKTVSNIENLPEGIRIAYESPVRNRFIRRIVIAGAVLALIAIASAAIYFKKKQKGLPNDSSDSIPKEGVQNDKTVSVPLEP